LISFLTLDETNISGTVATAGIMALVTLSFHSKLFRRYAFQMWLSSHIIVAIAVVVALIFHGVITIMVFVGGWWTLDLLVRYGIMTTCQYRIPTDQVQLRRIAHAKNDPAHHTHEPAIEISFVKPPGFQYSPGQFVQVAIPALSIFEFHPVSLSSAPHEEYVTMHFRDRGNWTHRLVQLADTKSSTAIWMEGPYGSLSVDVYDANRYQMVLLLCAGIGVTPIQSIGKSILHAHQHQNRPLKHMRMVWVVRDMNIVHDIPPLGLEFMNHVANSDDSNNINNVQVDIYCTRTTGKKQEQSLRDDDPEEGLPSPPPVRIPNHGTSTPAPNVTNDDGSGCYYNVQHGKRPDMDVIFSQMQQRANQELGEYNICVVACGPTSFMTQVKVACRTYSQSSLACHQSGVYFDLHTEQFEF
jgi:hypothetical protein